MLLAEPGITPCPSCALFADTTNIRRKKPVWFYAHTGRSILTLSPSLDLIYS